MKICHVAPELLPVPPTKGGAIERWIRDAAMRLAARGHDVHVMPRDHGDGRASETIDGVHYHYVRVPPAIDRGLPAGDAARPVALRRRPARARARSRRTSCITTAGPRDCG